MARTVIALKGVPEINEEDTAAAAITPGDLMDYDGSGNWIRHAGAGLNAVPSFALERDELGSGVLVAYASGDIVKAGTFHTGQRVYATLSSGENVAKGALLESDGAGLLQALVTDAATDDTQRVSVVARAMEAVNASAGALRIRVEVV